MRTFNEKEIERYQSHLILKKIGREGQKKLKNSSVLCVGIGGIGSPSAYYLTACGIGRLGIIDNDCVSLSNLTRQILYFEKDINCAKVDIAKQKLNALNSNVLIESYNEKFNLQNAEKIINKYDMVFDGSDNYETRYLVNDVCHYLKKGLVSASVFQFSGQVGIFNYKGSPCLRCLYPMQPPQNMGYNCADVGVLGVIPGVLGNIAVLELIKLIVNTGDKLIGKLITFDGLNSSIEKHDLINSPDCPLCTKIENYKTINKKTTETSVCKDRYITPKELKKLQIENNNIIIIDVREEFEREKSKIMNSIHISLRDLEKIASKLDKSKHIIVYCELGMRSREAVSILINKKFKSVKSLTGGMKAYNKSSLDYSERAKE